MVYEQFFELKVMISSCQHIYDNLSFTGILHRLIFVRVYDSWILSFLLFTLGFAYSTIPERSLHRTACWNI